jgi:predicted lipoprotein with Yx(FWY)xxD motif
MQITSKAATGSTAPAVALTLVCGGSSNSGSTGSPPTTAPSPTPTPIVATASVTVGGAPTTILVDAKGMTLYHFTTDKGGKVTCTAGCLAVWPRLLLPADQTKPTGGSGVTVSLTTIANPDGKGTQVLYNNWPLYYFAKDKNPGDVTGQNVAGKWFVVPPNLAAGA